MNLHYSTEGFVFKKEDRLEADRIFSVFTRDFGRIGIFAKAIRKINSKLRGNIEIFYLSKVEFIQGKNRKTLTDTASIEKFKNIENIPENLGIAYKISDVLDSFIRGEEKDDNIFDLLDETFSKLNDLQFRTSPSYAAPNDKFSLPADKQELIYLYFLWNFVFILGHGPELSRCSVCFQKLNPDNLCFSNKEGGIICKNCAGIKKDALMIKSDVVKILRIILKKDWDMLLKLKIEKSSQNDLKRISEEYSQYLLSNYSSH